MTPVVELSDRPFGSEPVRPVILKLVGKIAACHEDSAPPGLFDGFADHLPKRIVIRERQPGKAYPQNLKISVLLTDKIQRHHAPVIQPALALPQRSGRKLVFRGKQTDLIQKILVISFIKRDPRCAEIRKRPLRSPAGRDMEIVGIHNAVRAGDNDRLGLQRRDLLRRLLISAGRFLDLRLRSPPDIRNDHGRMRHHKSSQDRHQTHLLILSDNTLIK